MQGAAEREARNDDRGTTSDAGRRTRRLRRNRSRPLAAPRRSTLTEIRVSEIDLRNPWALSTRYVALNSMQNYEGEMRESNFRSASFNTFSRLWPVFRLSQIFKRSSRRPFRLSSAKTVGAFASNAPLNIFKRISLAQNTTLTNESSTLASATVFGPTLHSSHVERSEMHRCSRPGQCRSCEAEAYDLRHRALP